MSNLFADKIGKPPFPENKEVLELPFQIKGIANKMASEIMIKTNAAIRRQNRQATHNKQVIFGNVPSKSNCYRIVTFKSKDPEKNGYSTLAKTGDLKKYEKAFALQCNLYRNAGIDKDFNFEMDVYYPSRRSDLDNSLKVVLDCLQVVGAIKNDNLCQEIIVRRHIDARNPRIEFVIKTI
jgi:Holliday junction resolvase RusA-like endonuclease